MGMHWSRLIRKYRFLLAILAGVAFALWCTSPIWRGNHLLFMGKPSTDNVVTPWFYDFVARSMWEGEDHLLLRDLNYPRPHLFKIEFPSSVDAQVAAPLAWLFEWPQQWSATLTAVVLFNCLALVALVRVIGLGPMAVAFTGMSAVLMRPMWSDMVKGRMNVLTPGFAVLALVGILLCFPKDAQRQPRTLRQRLFGAGLAVLMGSLAALIYPPFLLMLIPVGVTLVWPFLRSGGAFGWVLGGLATALSYFLVREQLWGIYAQNHRVIDCSDLSCPDKYNSIALSSLAIFEPVQQQGLSFSGIQGAIWFLLPLVLLHKKRWHRGALLAITAVLFAGMSLGPCLAQTPMSPQTTEWPMNLEVWMNPIWCLTMHLHDFGRFALMASVVLILCGAMAIDAFEQRRLKWLGALFGGGVVYGMYAPLMEEILSPKKWHLVPQNPIAEFLSDKSEAVVVELPFDRSAQFLSVLESPGAKRLNPLRPFDPPPTMSPVHQWLYSIGRGKEASVHPSLSELGRDPLDWILYDEQRCGRGSIPTQRCRSWLPEELRKVLGDPIELPTGVLVWKTD